MVDRDDFRIRTWEEYLKWWRTTQSNNSRNPNAPEHVVRNAYERYVMRKKQEQAMGYVPPWRTRTYRSDDQQRIDEYEYTNRSNAVVHHADGDPTNNSLSNLRIVDTRIDIGLVRLSNGCWVTAEYAANQNIPYDIETDGGFTTAEAINMNAKIVKVFFDNINDWYEGVTTYEYLVPKDWELTRGDIILLPHGSLQNEVKNKSNVVIATVIDVVDLSESQADVKLKWAIQKVDVEQYNNRVTKQKKREQLLKQATKLAEDRSSIEKLTKLIGDSEEGKKLLAEIAALDNE